MGWHRDTQAHVLNDMGSHRTAASDPMYSFIASCKEPYNFCDLTVFCHAVAGLAQVIGIELIIYRTFCRLGGFAMDVSWIVLTRGNLHTCYEY